MKTKPEIFSASLQSENVSELLIGRFRKFQPLKTYLTNFDVIARTTRHLQQEGNGEGQMIPYL